MFFGAKDFDFTLPEQVNLVAHYQAESFTTEGFSLGYLARYKRQGDVNFYYAGVELGFESSALRFMLDMEHLSPEIQYSNSWCVVTLAIDDIEINKAMQFSLGLSGQYSF